MPYLRKYSNLQNQFLLIFQGLACMLDGLLLAGSLGFVSSNFQIRACKYRINIELQKQKAKQNANH